MTMQQAPRHRTARLRVRRWLSAGKVSRSTAQQPSRAKSSGSRKFGSAARRQRGIIQPEQGGVFIAKRT